MLNLSLLSLVLSIHGTWGITCPTNYSNFFADGCYRINSIGLSWDDQRVVCLADGADLTSIHSSAEDAALKAAVPLYHYWIGIQCDESNNPYWSDGSPVDYTNMDSPCIQGVTFLFRPHEATWQRMLFDGALPYYGVCTLVVPTECGLNYNLVEGTNFCTKVNTRVNTWRTAESVCAEEGGHLISIHSQQMNDYARRVALSYGFVDGFFIGMQLVDRQTPAWTDNTDFDYNNFDSGMPNWMFGECGAMQTGNLFGKWTSAKCDSLDLLPSICARPVTCSMYNTVEEQGEILSPDYPNSLVTGLHCEFYLAATPGDVVVLRFFEVSLQLGDSIVLYDGLYTEVPLAVVTQLDPDARYATKKENVMKVVHKTGASAGKRYWRASFLSD